MDNSISDREQRLQNSTEEHNIGSEMEAIQRLLPESISQPPAYDDIPALHIYRKEDKEDICKMSNLERAKKQYFDAQPFGHIVKINAEHTVTRETQTTSMAKLIEAKYGEDNGLSPNYIPVFDFAIIMVVFNIVVPFCGLMVFLRAMF